MIPKFFFRVFMAALLAVAGMAMSARAGSTRAGEPARADIAISPILSGGDLADLCAADPRDAEGVAKRNICVGFTLAVLAVAERQQTSGGPKLFCPQNPAPAIGETIDAFVQLTRALPPTRSAPVIDALLRFLQERFPCPQ
jgi:hypothetical protein